MIGAGLVCSLVTSHIGTNPQTQQLLLARQIEVTPVPQGTLAERIRAGGVGLGGVLTPTGVGTLAADGKQLVELEGRVYLLETALKADFSLIRAQRADYYGNLTFVVHRQVPGSEFIRPLRAESIEHYSDFLQVGIGFHRGQPADSEWPLHASRAFITRRHGSRRAPR